MGERSGGGAIQPGGGGDLRDPESRSDPLPGDHAHDEQVWQDSGRGDRKWKGQKASGDLHQRHRRGTRGGADRAIDLSALAMIVERTGYMKLEGGRLEVTLRRFTDREIDYAARHLCEDLNRMQPVTLDKFHLPIRYHVQ